MDKIKISTLLTVLTAVAPPLLAAFPWMGLITSPLAQEVMLRHQTVPYEWLLLALFYLLYLFGSPRIRRGFAVFTLASIGAFVVSIILKRLSEDSCVPYGQANSGQANTSK